MAAAVAVRLKGVSKKFDQTDAVKSVDLVLPQGRLTSLLGPSGCGKTTLLRLIAGLEVPDSGTIEINGRSVENLPIHLRNIGFVFQNYALFPHRTVGENIAFGLKHRGADKQTAAEKVRRVLDVVRLGGMQDRYPNQLSGGQQQRVALARAVVFEPSVLLLDEPLSALDANLREEVRVEIKMIQKTLGLTTILVTHDQQEALAMSDEVVVMRQGSVQQSGDPRTVYQFPRNRFVASFLGHANGCRGVMVEPAGASEWLVRLEGGIALRGTPGGPPGELVQLSRGEAVDVVIRGSELLVSAFEGQCEDGANSFTGVIADASFLGDDAHYVIDAGGTRLTAVCRIAGAGTDGHGATIPAGSRVRVDVPPRACVILPIA